MYSAIPHWSQENVSIHAVLTAQRAWGSADPAWMEMKGEV